MQKNIKSSVLRCKSVDPRHRRDVVIFAETETQKQQQQQQKKLKTLRWHFKNQASHSKDFSNLYPLKCQ